MKLLLSVGCLLALSPIAYGQAVYGSIFGTVTDSTGAVVPNATVTVTDVAKGTSSSEVSNGSGEFTADHLIPDIYDVKVTASDSRLFVQKGIQVYADTSTKIQVALTTGATTETVEVNADAVPQLRLTALMCRRFSDRGRFRICQFRAETSPVCNFCCRARRSLDGATPPARIRRAANRSWSMARLLLASPMSWMEPIIRIRSSASSLSIRTSIRWRSQRSRRRTTTRSSARPSRP